jgi:hypothetical protein
MRISDNGMVEYKNWGYGYIFKYKKPTFINRRIETGALMRDCGV